MVRTRNPQAGFSLVEVIATSAILLAMVYVVTTLAISGSDAQDYSRRLNRATEINQDIIDDIRLELVSSVHLFGNDANGNDTMAKLDMTAAPAVLTSSLLPTIVSSGSVQKDTAGNEITGNTLFFARWAWTDDFRCTSGQTYLVNVYRWVRYYLTPEGSGPGPGSMVGLNLVRIDSEPLADGSEVDRISDPADQAEVMSHMVHGTADINGVEHPVVAVVWLRGANPNSVGTFRQIDPSDGALSNNPILPSTLPWMIKRDNPVANGLLAYRHFSVASNYARASMGIGRFGLVSNSGAGFPHGFEIQIVGPSSARQVLAHLILASTGVHGQIAWSDLQSVIDARDL
jgi:hypothetical protein